MYMYYVIVSQGYVCAIDQPDCQLLLKLIMSILYCVAMVIDCSDYFVSPQL